MERKLIGVDIGGTKCAVCIGRQQQGEMSVLARQSFPTPLTPQETFSRIMETISLLREGHDCAAIGISCGGPLDSRSGIVYSPPNLPGWDAIDVVTPLRERFALPTWLENDANAGALAEWLWGAGRGYRNVVFLTFGTGMGAGFVLDGRLYRGSSDLAGEVGHVRLAEQGPEGFGKAGSFEGFCGGSGIARLGQQKAQEWLAQGEVVGYCPTLADLPQVTAERIGHAARAGDAAALRVWEIVARRLGQGLAMLVDVLNPDCIILGSIYLRQRELLEPLVLRVLREEALPGALAVCRIVPAGLGEQIGDFASLAVALHHLQE
ncbi:MAG: ROK family protein [Ktedonobacteraceae bacterium]|nr:ROK family protein [Ktedonobacteraceae bacterium]